MTTLATTTIRNQNAKHEPGKTITLHYTDILRATLQRGYRKRMIEIWQECASVQTTSERLADQLRIIIKKGWLSDLDILDIHQKTKKQDNTIPVTSSDANQKQHTRNELLTLESKNATLPSGPEETLSQEQKINVENVKRIMNSEILTYHH